MIYTLDEIKKRILPVIEKNNIPAMYLFGSYARGEATEDSDLDFLVDTTGTSLTSLLALGALYCDLEEVFQKASTWLRCVPLCKMLKRRVSAVSGIRSYGKG